MSIKTNLTTSANLAAELAKFIDVKLVARSTSAQAFSDSYTPYIFASELVDSANAFDGTTFVVPYTTGYDVSVSIPFSPGGIDGKLDLVVYVNGSPVETLDAHKDGASAVSPVQHLNGSLSQYPLTAGDSVTIFIRNIITTAVNTNDSLTSTYGTLTISARVKLP